MPAFGKRTPLTKEHFKAFELAYGNDPNGNSQRVNEGETGRWCRFTREEISKRGENLDITWLRDESLQSGDNLPEPEIIAAQIMTKLQTAMDEMQALMLLLEGDPETEAKTEALLE
jgi:type I restriction enzyme M protein